MEKREKTIKIKQKIRQGKTREPLSSSESNFTIFGRGQPRNLETIYYGNWYIEL